MHNGDPYKSDTMMLIDVLRHLSKNIYSEDWVANAVMAEAADRMEELDHHIRRLEMRIDDLVASEGL